MTTKSTVLVVDDEPNIVELNRMYLENAGYRVVAARTGATQGLLQPARFCEMTLLTDALPLLEQIHVILDQIAPIWFVP